MIWNDIALKHKTDKSTSFSKMQTTGHGYMAAYQIMLEHKEVWRVLEIGVDEGNSLRMWAELFPYAKIFGMDIDEKCRNSTDDRISIIIADAGNPEQLRVFASWTFPLDLIVDDGSHKKEDVLLALRMLFSTLTPTGVYAIEDMVWDDIRDEVEAWATDKRANISVFPSLNSNQSIIFIEKRGAG